MRTGTTVIFLMEKVIHSPKPDAEPHRKILVEVPAVYKGESEAWCKVCHEPMEGHSRNGRRKHLFEPETGATVEVHYPPSKVYPDGQTEIRQRVPQGTEANCWKEK